MHVHFIALVDQQLGNVAIYFNATYFWLLTIFPDVSISYMACRRHLTSSVGQRTNEEKIDATDPAQAFWKSLKKREQREDRLVTAFYAH